MRRALISAVLLAFAAGCAGGSGTQPSPSPSAGPALHNPLNIALYPGAKLVAVRQFTQRVDVNSDVQGDTVVAGGNGVYSGTEVIASTPASFSHLSAWTAQIEASPPAGYAAAGDNDDSDDHIDAQRHGIDYARLKRIVRGKRQEALLLVMDPNVVDRRLGPLLGLISKYRSLPSFMRGPIDNEAKSQFGMTLTQALAPESPIGAALGALTSLQRSNERGIIVIVARKV